MADNASGPQPDPISDSVSYNQPFLSYASSSGSNDEPSNCNESRPCKVKKKSRTRRWRQSPNWRAFFRAIGLHILSFVGYQDQEGRKVILTKSLGRAFTRCGVHIIPVLAELVILWVGFYGVLFGHAYAWRLAAMQVTAKVLELLALGSLSVIVLEVLRYKLLRSATGLPFGLLAAGFNFTQINWFWSPAFLFSLRCSWNQAFLTAVLMLCGLLALAMGPATAILLVPVQRVCVSNLV